MNLDQLLLYYRNQTLKAVENVMIQFFLEIYLVALLGLPWSKYKLLITIFQKQWLTSQQKFSPLQLHWHLPFQLSSLISKMPWLLPSSKQVRLKWNEIYTTVVKPKIFSIDKIKVIEWLIPDIIEYICGNIVLMALITVPVDTLEVILKLDAFSVAGGSCLLMFLTLSNFELLCKTSCLHFIIAIANCNNHERDIVAQVLANNFAIINQLAATRIIWV